MSVPIILLVGHSGSGKDTVASFLVKNYGAVSIAQADPLKRFAKYLFEFTDEQLWGPSECRNSVDIRYGHTISRLLPRMEGNKFWQQVWNKLYSGETNKWIIDVVGNTSNVSKRETTKGVIGLPYNVNFDHERAGKLLNTWAIDLFEKCKISGVTPRIVLQTLGSEWGRVFKKDLWIDYAKRVSLSLLGGEHRYNSLDGLIYDKNYKCAPIVVITDGRFINEVLSISQINGNVWKISCPQSDGSSAENAGIKGHISEQEQKGISVYYFNKILENDKNEGLGLLEKKVNFLVKTLIGV